MLSNRTIGLSAVIVALLAAVAGWLLLKLYGAGTEADKVRLDAIRTVGTIILGAAGAIALLLAARRQQTAERELVERRRDLIHKERVDAEQHAYQLRVADANDQDTAERRITELYTRAAEQLGSDKAPVRLAGLYALERLAQDNVTQRRTIISVLCAYLRMPYSLPGDPPAPDAGKEELAEYLEQAQEREVRLTAQRILGQHLIPGSDTELADTYWGPADMDLTGATLIDFNLAKCRPGNAILNRAQFIGTADFQETQFMGDASFHAGRFISDVSFRGAKFMGESQFSGTQFIRVASFYRARFMGDASFHRVRFTGAASFRESQFTRGAYFPRTRFADVANFRRARFKRTVTFGEAEFNGATYFRKAQFTGLVSFRESQFMKDAFFDQSQFISSAEFGGVRVAGNAWFTKTMFQDVSFTGARFVGDASFAETWFAGDAWFDGTTFFGEAYFDQLPFRGHYSFSNAHFERDVSANVRHLMEPPASYAREATLPD